MSAPTIINFVTNLVAVVARRRPRSAAVVGEIMWSLSGRLRFCEQNMWLMAGPVETAMTSAPDARP